MSPPPVNLVLGLIWALLTVLAWSGYNLAAVAGIAQGFRPIDLTVLRFGVSGLLLLPLGAVLYACQIREIGWVRLFGLSILGGPLFGVFATAGFQYAPLSHGLVFAPAAVLGVGLAWGRAFGRPGFSRLQILGAGLLTSGLFVLSGFDLEELGPSVLLGDVSFVAAGLMWGSFTFFIGHWRLSPGSLICGVGGFALLQVLCVAPFALPGWPDVTASQLLMQAGFQGVIGGGLALLTFALAIRTLGAARASALPSLTPIMGFVLGYMFMSAVPDAAEVTGSMIASAGLALILTARSR